MTFIATAARPAAPTRGELGTGTGPMKPRRPLPPPALLAALALLAACSDPHPPPLPTLLVESVEFAPGRPYSIYGYNAPDGTRLIPPVYDQAEPFHPSGFAVVHRDALGGLVDRHGREVIPPLHRADATDHAGARRLALDDAQSTHFGELPNVFLESAADFHRHFPGTPLPAGLDFARELVVGIRTCRQCRQRDRPENELPEPHRNAHRFTREWWAVPRLPAP
jgi:hypothetical protein